MVRAQARYEITAQDRTARAFNSVTKRLRSTTAAFARFGNVMAGAVLAGFGAMIKKSIDFGDQVQKMAIRTGAATEFLSEMRGVAELSGVSFGTVTTALKKQSRTIVDAQSGLKAAADAYKKLGLDVDALVQMRPQDQFALIGDALKAVTNDTERSALAMEVWGRSGTDVLSITQQGSAAIAQLRDQQKALGQSISRDMADRMAEANDAMTLLKGSVQGVGIAMAADFAGPIKQVANFLRSVVVPIVGVVSEVFKTSTKFLGGFAAALVSFFSGEFRQAMTIAELAIADVSEGVGKAFEKAKEGIEKIKRLNDQTDGFTRPAPGEPGTPGAGGAGARLGSTGRASAASAAARTSPGLREIVTKLEAALGISQRRGGDPVLNRNSAEVQARLDELGSMASRRAAAARGENPEEKISTTNQLMRDLIEAVRELDVRAIAT